MHKCASPDAPQTEAEGDRGYSLGHGGRRGSSHLLAGTPQERALLGTARWEGPAPGGKRRAHGADRGGQRRCFGFLPCPSRLSPHSLVVRKAPGECPGVPDQKGWGAHSATGPGDHPWPREEGRDRSPPRPSKARRQHFVLWAKLRGSEGPPQVSGTWFRLPVFSLAEKGEWRAQGNFPHPPGHSLLTPEPHSLTPARPEPRDLPSPQ